MAQPKCMICGVVLTGSDQHYPVPEDQIDPKADGARVGFIHGYKDAARQRETRCLQVFIAHRLRGEPLPKLPIPPEKN